eukprot:362156-Chlamydomonas_euryale.AAC.8
MRMRNGLAEQIVAGRMAGCATNSRMRANLAGGSVTRVPLIKKTLDRTFQTSTGYAPGRKVAGGGVNVSFPLQLPLHAPPLLNLAHLRFVVCLGQQHACEERAHGVREPERLAGVRRARDRQQAQRQECLRVARFRDHLKHAAQYHAPADQHHTQARNRGQRGREEAGDEADGCGTRQRGLSGALDERQQH